MLVLYLFLFDAIYPENQILDSGLKSEKSNLLFLTKVQFLYIITATDSLQTLLTVT